MPLSDYTPKTSVGAPVINTQRDSLAPDYSDELSAETPATQGALPMSTMPIQNREPSFKNLKRGR